MNEATLALAWAFSRFIWIGAGLFVCYVVVKVWRAVTARGATYRRAGR